MSHSAGQTVHRRRGGIAPWLLAARPQTLWAAISPVIVGTAIAIADSVWHGPSAFFALLGAILIQIGTNYSNDYHDFIKGADTDARKGPTRATHAGLVAPDTMRNAAAITFGLAVVSGLYLIFRGGLPILVIGILSVISGIWYTAGRYSLAYTGLADLFVLIFFGPVAVGGTYYVQALTVTPAVIAAGFGPGLLAVAILLVNNIRDIDEDREANKRTLVVRLGRNAGVGLYLFVLIASALLPVALVMVWNAPITILLASFVPLVGIPVFRSLRRHRDADNLNPLLGRTSQLLFGYSLAFSLGWMIG